MNRAEYIDRRGVHLGHVDAYGQAAQSPLSRAGDSMYNRKAFAWNHKDFKPPERPQPPPQKQQVTPPECPNRIFEIVIPTGTVRAEPHMNSKFKAKKSRGGRLICSEITMNGWVKLANEPGWLLTHHQGIDSVAEVALPVDGRANGLGGELLLAVQDYQPQGLVCLEVLGRSGGAVRERPSQDAPSRGTRRTGEYVFAHLQNFDGWVKLHGEEGWMLGSHAEWGELLKLRLARGVDLWALSDAWAAARKPKNGNLSPGDVAELKELERRILAATSSLYDKHVTEDKMQDLIDTGLLDSEDLTHSDHWTFQRLFASVLKQAWKEEARLQALMPDFALSQRVPPLFGAEEDWQDEAWLEQDGGVAPGPGVEYDPDDPIFKDHTPVEFGGRTFMMAPNGALFDPPNQTPIGIWNDETNRIEPAAGMVPGCPYPALSYFGSTYLLMPDGKLLEPDSQKVVGSFDRDSHQLNLENDPQVAMERQGLIGGKAAAADPVLDDDEPVDPQEYLEQGHRLAKSGKVQQALALFDKAALGLSRLRNVDVSLECEILRARAACHAQLGNYRELRDDADRILGCFPGDAEAQDWKRHAGDKIRQSKFSLGEPAQCTRPSNSIAPTAVSGCPQCNGLASKCATCGAGMQRCANCAAIVSKANCCSRCHSTYYCGRECQRAHWKIHKLECKA